MNITITRDILEGKGLTTNEDVWSWFGQDSDYTNIEIRYRKRSDKKAFINGSAPWQMLADDDDRLPVTLAGLEPDTEYVFQVRAIDADTTYSTDLRFVLRNAVEERQVEGVESYTLSSGAVAARAVPLVSEIVNAAEESKPLTRREYFVKFNEKFNDMISVVNPEMNHVAELMYMVREAYDLGHSRGNTSRVAEFEWIGPTLEDGTVVTERGTLTYNPRLDLLRFTNRQWTGGSIYDPEALEQLRPVEVDSLSDVPDMVSAVSAPNYDPHPELTDFVQKEREFWTRLGYIQSKAKPGYWVTPAKEAELLKKLNAE